MSRERRLGRGLAALLGDAGEGSDAAQLHSPKIHRPESDHHVSNEEAASSSELVPDGQMLMLSVYEIEDNPYQPRRDFTESEIVSLAESLKEHDMLQPVLVRRVGQRWQLISGERRLRAAIHAGWTEVPARVRQADDRLVAELAIVENLQRKDLNPIEKALSFRRYLDEHGSTQEELGKRLKIDRSTIANLLRLLELPESVQKDLQVGAISAGHARALLPLGEEAIQIEYANKIRKEGISVREIERIVQERVQQEDNTLGKGTGRRRKRNQDPQLAALEQKLKVALGTRVDIKTTSRNRGQIVVHFRSIDEFQRIIDAIDDSDLGPTASFAG